jgi:hypothetical protein
MSTVYHTQPSATNAMALTVNELAVRLRDLLQQNPKTPPGSTALQVEVDRLQKMCVEAVVFGVQHQQQHKYQQQLAPLFDTGSPMVNKLLTDCTNRLQNSLHQPSDEHVLSSLFRPQGVHPAPGPTSLANFMNQRSSVNILTPEDAVSKTLLSAPTLQSAIPAPPVYKPRPQQRVQQLRQPQQQATLHRPTPFTFGSTMYLNCPLLLGATTTDATSDQSQNTAHVFTHYCQEWLRQQQQELAECPPVESAQFISGLDHVLEANSLMTLGLQLHNVALDWDLRVQRWATSRTTKSSQDSASWDSSTREDAEEAGYLLSEGQILAGVVSEWKLRVANIGDKLVLPVKAPHSGMSAHKGFVAITHDDLKEAGLLDVQDILNELDNPQERHQLESAKGVKRMAGSDPSNESNNAFDSMETAGKRKKSVGVCP